mgnify:CR=1 FL=1
MNISYNWLKQFLKLKDSAEEIASTLTELGLEVEGITDFQSIKGGLNSINGSKVS